MSCMWDLLNLSRSNNIQLVFKVFHSIFYQLQKAYTVFVTNYK